MPKAPLAVRAAIVALLAARLSAQPSLPLPGDLPDAAVAERIAEGDRLRSSGDGAAAFSAYAEAVANSGSMNRKREARDKIVAMGPTTPPPLTDVEREIVANRIRAEKERYLREVAGRLYDQGLRRGARALLVEVRGLVEAQGGSAVIGDLSRAVRATKAVKDIEAEILASGPREEIDEADAAVEATKDAATLFAKALALTKARKPFAARRIYLHLAFGDSDRSTLDRAQTALAEIETSLLDDLSAEERKTIEMASEHPVWRRLDAVPSQRFVFIGDKEFIRRIPPASALRLDVAYVFLTDLFGRVPNPDGVRLTVYWKELWRFAGGVGGGTIIDVGVAEAPPLMEASAKWERKGTPTVDDGFFYHELTHCISDMKPDYAGFVEGLANFGAAYVLDTLHQKGDSLHSFESNLNAFRRDYLARRVAYWRIPNYGPSAGFFLHFADKYSRGKDGTVDWTPYRVFFRHYRETPWKTERTFSKIRTMYRSFRVAFGDGVLGDLRAFRFPLETGVDSLVEKEATKIAPALDAAIRTGDPRALATIADEHPDSHLGRLARVEEARHRAQFQDEEEAAAIAREECGAITAFRVCGPFFPEERGNGLEEVFPPEDATRFDARYSTSLGDARWHRPGENGPVSVSAAGRVDFKWSYPENAVSYALVFADSPNETDAFVHVGADDAVALWVNDRLVEKIEDRGALMTDQDRLPVRLAEGRNRLLFKVANRSGPTALAARLVLPNGDAIDGLRQDAGTSADEGPRLAPKAAAFETIVKDDLSRGKLGKGFREAIGEWRPTSGALAGAPPGGTVLWRKYTVRPGFPKDSPSHLLWLLGKGPSAAEKDLKLDLALSLQRPGHPKIAVTLDGEGETDGLSGWTLILHPSGRGALSARFEEYDRLVYSAPTAALPESLEWKLSIVRVDGFVSVTANGAPLFRAVSTAPLDPPHVGIATWGAAPGIRSIALSRVKKREARPAPVDGPSSTK
jgi:hypothetical protein